METLLLFVLIATAEELTSSSDSLLTFRASEKS